MATPREDPIVAPRASQRPPKPWASKELAKALSYPDDGEWHPDPQWSLEQASFAEVVRARVKRMWVSRVHKIVGNERQAAERKARSAAKRAVVEEQDRILTLLITCGYIDAARVVAESCPGVEVVPAEEALRNVA